MNLGSLAFCVFLLPFFPIGLVGAIEPVGLLETICIPTLQKSFIYCHYCLLKVDGKTIPSG